MRPAKKIHLNFKILNYLHEVCMTMNFVTNIPIYSKSSNNVTGQDSGTHHITSYIETLKCTQGIFKSISFAQLTAAPFLPTLHYRIFPMRWIRLDSIIACQGFPL